MKHLTPLRASLIAVLSMGLISAATAAEWEPLFRGVDHRLVAQELKESQGLPARTIKGHAVRIDSVEPGIRFVATPGNGDLPLETNGETVQEFIKATGVQLAINSGFFGPCCEPTSGQPKDLIGLAVAAGQLVSPAQQLDDRTVMSLLVDSGKGLRFAPIDGESGLEGIDLAVSGFPKLVTAGKVEFPEEKVDGFNGPNPRTAIGLGPDRRFLYLLVVDGRLPGHSAGTTLFETGRLLVELGVTEGLNLDGGGSTVMAIAGGDGKPQLLSRPSGGRPRVNAAHFGVVAEPLPANQPAQSSVAE